MCGVERGENNDGTLMTPLFFSLFLVFCCLTTHKRPVNKSYHSKLNTTIFLFGPPSLNARDSLSRISRKCIRVFAKKLGGFSRQNNQKDTIFHIVTLKLNLNFSSLKVKRVKGIGVGKEVAHVRLVVIFIVVSQSLIVGQRFSDLNPS